MHQGNNRNLMVAKPVGAQNYLLKKHYQQYKLDFKDILVVRSFASVELLVGLLSMLQPLLLHLPL